MAQVTTAPGIGYSTAGNYRKQLYGYSERGYERPTTIGPSPRPLTDPEIAEMTAALQRFDAARPPPKRVIAGKHQRAQGKLLEASRRTELAAKSAANCAEGAQKAAEASKVAAELGNAAAKSARQASEQTNAMLVGRHSFGGDGAAELASNRVAIRAIANRNLELRQETGVAALKAKLANMSLSLIHI